MEALRLLAGLALFTLAFRYGDQVQVPQVRITLRDLLPWRPRTDP